MTALLVAAASAWIAVAVCVVLLLDERRGHRHELERRDQREEALLVRIQHPESAITHGNVQQIAQPKPRTSTHSRTEDDEMDARHRAVADADAMLAARGLNGPALAEAPPLIELAVDLPPGATGPNAGARAIGA